MKKVFPFFSIILFTLFFLAACKKNKADEQYTEIVNPVYPDLITQVNATVDGFITDENGNAIQNASAKAGSVTVNTDKYGYFRINNQPFSKSAGFIEVTKPGYFTGYRTFLPKEGKESFIRLQLIPKTNIAIINALAGGIVSTVDGASVTLPANAVVTASGNITYNGNIHVAAHWLNPAEFQTTQQTMPGDLRGIDSSGYLNVLVTYGMIAVELTGDAGELLQLANGKKASLSFPIPAALQASAPASIRLWYFDTSTGLWKQDGNASKNGNSYKGDVTHFSFWNCDLGASVVNFSAQILDMTLNPIANIAVSIRIVGIPNSERISYTNANGEVNGMIPSNSNLVMKVMSTCNASLLQQNIVTTNSDVNLGSIKADLQQYGAVFSGTVQNCGASPVTNGYVIIAGVGYNHVINLQNGAFNTALPVCQGQNATVVAIDRETSQQSLPQNFLITTGNNDLGNLSACTPTNVENITYILDGVPASLGLPQHMFDGKFGLTLSYTELKAIDLLNGSTTVFFIHFISVDAPGSYGLTGFTLDRQYEFVNPTSIVITAYGLIGQFITGSFSGEVKDLTDNSIHSFSCTINIKRDS